MEKIPILKDLVVLMAVSVPVTILFNRLGLPAIIGFLIAGVIIGPHGAGLITNVHAVDVLAEIGVVLLLFVVGLEFSLTKMSKLKREGILGGGLQVLITAAVPFILVIIGGYTASQAIVIGFAVALSSTAIVLKLLSDRGEIDTPQGKLAISILLFQDICVVPMIITIKTIAEAREITFLSIAQPMLFAAAAVSIILAASYILVPKLLYQVVRLRNKEVFTLTVLLLCFGTAWLTHHAGLSLALGAFIAGLVISESEYSHQIVAEVLTFRDTFLSLFFISIGMLVDLRHLVGSLGWLTFMTGSIILLKIAIVVVIGQALRYPLRLSLIVGMGLAQIGEFSFILIKMGKEYNLLSPELYQDILASSVLTMAATPFLVNFSHSAAFSVARFLNIKTVSPDAVKEPSVSGHVVIIGFGLNGRNLARVVKEVGINYRILDMDWERVKRGRDEGYKVMFGDASQIEILHKLNIDTAKMLVVGISDPTTTRLLVKLARDINERLYILVRTRNLTEVEELYKLGANQVIPEEFETSIEIFARVLKQYHIPGNVIQNQIDIIRHEGYAMLRSPSLPREKMTELTSILSASLTETFFVKDDSYLVGKSLVEIDLRRRSGVMILAVVRNAVPQTNPPSEMVVEAGDILAIIGSHEQIERAMQVLGEKDKEL